MRSCNPLDLTVNSKQNMKVTRTQRNNKTFYRNVITISKFQ